MRLQDLLRTAVAKGFSVALLTSLRRCRPMTQLSLVLFLAWILAVAFLVLMTAPGSRYLLSIDSFLGTAAFLVVASIWRRQFL
jgi:hypothetical protein